MLKNYFKTAWRNIIKNKMYSAINIGGLAVGMAVSFLLLLYVYNEFSYNSNHDKLDRIYMVYRNQPGDGEVRTSNATPVPLGPAMKKDYPEVEKVARSNGSDDVLMSVGDKSIKLNTLAAEPAILDIFSFPIVYGDKSNALSDINSIVLTEAGAISLFGNTNVVGKTIYFKEEDRSMKVSAIIKDQPANSSAKFKALISWEGYAAGSNWIKEAGWGNYSFSTYVLLKPGVSLASFNAKFKNIVKHYDPKNKQNAMFLYPFKRMRLYGNFKNGVEVDGAIEYVRLFLYLAIGILLIACINFMNLSTARSERRAREVGVRKAVGARKGSLVKQFLSESILLALIAFVLSIVIMMLLLPLFREIMNLQVHLPYNNPGAWAAAIVVTLITGFVAGSYPALFMSSFKPIKVLKGQLITTKTTVLPRQVLVVLQFTFAICLIIFSLFIYRQIDYIKNRPVGYNGKGVLEMWVEGKMIDQFDAFRRDAISEGAITDGAITSGSITNNSSSTWGVTWPGQRSGEEKIPIDQIVVTYHFIDTYGLNLIAGRDFEVGRPADSAALILNQAAVKMMRLKQPLGSQVKWQDEQRTVIGVVEDFVWGSPYEPVKPAIIGFMKGWTGAIALRLNPAKPISESIAKLTSLYKKYNPAYPFEYRFTDERFDGKFKTEKLLGSMAGCFTVLAIIISCLGLFGLASFSAEQRRKEIGIRKVLGANTAQIWLKLSEEFVKLVVISFVVGGALSCYFVYKWLNHYTYHTNINAWVFVATMIISVALCLLTVSWQAIRAAWANPVNSLKNE